MQFLNRRWKLFILIGLWGIGSTYVLTLMSSLHYMPQKKDSLTMSSSETKQLEAHHFLSLNCACSKKLLNHLISRKAQDNTQETIHLIGKNSDLENQLLSKGYFVDTLVSEEEAVKKFNLTILPQLLVVKENRILYQGGYGLDQQHSSVYEDIKIINNAHQLIVTKEYPIFGCANGQLKKKLLDPLGLKYAESSNP